MHHWYVPNIHAELHFLSLDCRSIYYGLRGGQTQECPCRTSHPAPPNVAWVWCWRPHSAARVLPPSFEARTGCPPRILVTSSAPTLVHANTIYPGKMWGSRAMRMRNQWSTCFKDKIQTVLTTVSSALTTGKEHLCRRCMIKGIQTAPVSWPSSAKLVPKSQRSSSSSTTTVGHMGKPPMNIS